MKKQEKNLNDLFASLRTDAPIIEPEELRAHIASGKHIYPVGVIDIPSHPKQRKGIYIMSAIVLLLIGAFYLLYPQGTTMLTGNAPQQFSSHQNGSPITESPQTTIISVTEPKLPIKTEASWRDSLQFAKFPQVDLSQAAICSLSEENYSKIGLAKGENGTIYAYFRDTKFVFPTDSMVMPLQVYKKTDPLVESLGTLGMYPSYATDSRGNLLMWYRYEKTANSESIAMELPEFAKLMLPKMNYMAASNTNTKNVRYDSSLTPHRIFDSIFVRVGITQLDTAWWWVKAEEESHQKQISELLIRLRMKDSLLKMTYGGESGLEKRFRFPMPGMMYAQRSPEAKALRGIDSIGQKIKDPILCLTEKLTFLDRMIEDKHISDTTKLKFERLLFRTGYELHLLEHKEEEAKLAKINELIPLRIREATGKKLDPEYDNGLIFWYKPSEKLQSFLPNYCTQEVTTKSPKAIETTIYPNPAKNILFVQYALTERASVSAQIFDISGKQVTAPFMVAPRSAGNYTNQIPLDDIPSGIYFLYFATSSGEQSIQRIVIEK